MSGKIFGGAWSLALACALWCGLLTVRVQAAPGELDPTFGTNGKVTTSLGSTLGGAPRAVKSDFDGDGLTDVSVFRPSQGVWYILRSSNNSLRTQPFGLSDDFIAPADYDGDRITDIAVWRASDGFWYIINSSDNTVRAEHWGGGPSDTPVSADYDGDGKADLAVFRYGMEVSSPTAYYILQSSNQLQRAVQWGDGLVARAVPADYDGDGSADIAVYSEAGGVWRILQSSNGIVRSEAFGAGNFQDLTAPADYDGDGRTDLAVFRRASGTWYMQRSTAGFNAVQFGASGDVPVPGDYDGDGLDDVGVFRAGGWYMLRSTAGFTGVQFGTQGDLPAVRSR
jgi:hypothetical protein